MSAEMTDYRPRVWKFLIYEESMKKDYVKRFNTFGYAWYESPWHDQDRFTYLDEELNPEHKAGELKKKHKHLCLYAPNKMTETRALEIANYIGAVDYVKPDSSINHAVRYLAHLDNEDKFPYDKNLIVGHNGGDPYIYIQEKKLNTAKEQRDIIGQIVNFVRREQILDFATLVDIAYQRNPEWVPVLLSRQGAFIERYMNSNKQRYYSRNVRR